MDLQFGQDVRAQALKLESQGKDANQIAKILFEQDDQGHNYGIGVILDGHGQPMASSPVLLEYASAVLEGSERGDYLNSAKVMDELKRAVLKWQRIPETAWDSFKLALPSDAGTGAVKSAVELALMLNPDLSTLGIEELGWPAYKAIAKVARISVREFPLNDIIGGADVLPITSRVP